MKAARIFHEGNGITVMTLTFNLIANVWCGPHAVYVPQNKFIGRIVERAGLRGRLVVNFTLCLLPAKTCFIKIR